MNLNKIFSFFVPKDKVFFNLFDRASTNLVETAVALKSMLNEPNKEVRSTYIKKISDLEHVGDELTHELFTELSSNFITPFDREDIHYLATSLDDINDYIFASAKRVDLYNIDKVTAPMIRLSELLEESVMLIHKSITLLKNLDNYTLLRENLVKINSLENHADDIFNLAIADLFNYEKDAINLIKHQEILQHLETATDKCEDVANVIETIMIKNS